MRYLDGFRQGDAGRELGRRIGAVGQRLADQGRQVKLMEVCGSHTMAIARFGVRDLLPANVRLISGPGCPVCVTDTGYVDAAIQLARADCVVATFGDMVRVPGSGETLAQVRSEGARVEVCTSPLDALRLAQQEPERQVVFLAVGFETTTAPAAVLLHKAIEQGVTNLSLLTAFKLLPPALDVLMADPELGVHGFLCPAHVSAIIGANAYAPYAARGAPCVVAGFEPLDILYGVLELCEQLADGRAQVVNQYSRVVRAQGNPTAQALIHRYMQVVDAPWRGLGMLPASGLGLRPTYAAWDAALRHDLTMGAGHDHPGCRCGEVLKGMLEPDKCPLFATACTPSRPFGPCMVSSEGSCAAWHRYVRRP